MEFICRQIKCCDFQSKVNRLCQSIQDTVQIKKKTHIQITTCVCIIIFFNNGIVWIQWNCMNTLNMCKSYLSMEYHAENWMIFLFCSLSPSKYFRSHNKKKKKKKNWTEILNTGLWLLQSNHLSFYRILSCLLSLWNKNQINSWPNAFAIC